MVTPYDKTGKDLKWMKVFFTLMEDLLHNPLPQMETRVLYLILMKMDRDNNCFLTQKEMAEKTGIAVPHICKALKVLGRRGFLSRVINGRFKCYHFNSAFASKR